MVKTCQLLWRACTPIYLSLCYHGTSLTNSCTSACQYSLPAVLYRHQGGWETIWNLMGGSNQIFIQSRGISWTEQSVWLGKMRNAYKSLVWKSEGNISLKKSMCKWENNIKLNVKKEAIGIRTGLRIGPVMDFYDLITEPLVLIKYGKCID
jgi:hypothetical protein